MKTNEKAPQEVASSEQGAGINQLQSTTIDNKYQVPEEILLELAAMQKRYSEIYNETGLIGISHYGGVFLTYEAFLATFPEHNTVLRKSEEGLVGLWVMFGGARFYCRYEGE